ncbi:hypothetical protein GCM10027360_85170 [Amycolatopsis echigonensis]
MVDAAADGRRAFRRGVQVLLPQPVADLGELGDFGLSGCHFGSRPLGELIRRTVRPKTLARKKLSGERNSAYR